MPRCSGCTPPLAPPLRAPPAGHRGATPRELGKRCTLLLAYTIPAIPVHDPGGSVYLRQSLFVCQGSREINGRAVLIAAVRRRVERDAAMINTFSLPGDPERTDTLRRVGLSVVTEFFCQDVG